MKTLVSLIAIPALAALAACGPSTPPTKPVEKNTQGPPAGSLKSPTESFSSGLQTSSDSGADVKKK